MPMEWNGPEALARIRDETGKRIDMAARFIRDRAKEGLSRTQEVRIYGKKGKRSRKGMDPSQPGEFPKKVSGHLRIDTRKEFDKELLEARVGTNVPYGKWLELGTRTMARRPFMRLTLTQNAPELMRRFGIGVKI